MSKRHWNKREQEIRKEMLDKFEKMIDDKIEFNKLWLENKDFKGIQKDMLLSFQEQLEELKQKLKGEKK